MELKPENFTVISCASCGLEFCLSKAFMQRREEDCFYFHCPNGHPQAFTKPKGDSREVKKLKGRIADLETQVRKLRAEHFSQEYVDFLEDHPEGYKREVEDGIPSGG